MDDRDISDFLKAKKELLISELLAAVSMLPLLLLMIIEYAAIGTEYRQILVMLLFCLLVFAQGPSRWVTISRRTLIGIIERQINRDPVALELLAEKTSRPEYRA